MVAKKPLPTRDTPYIIQWHNKETDEGPMIGDVAYIMWSGPGQIEEDVNEMILAFRMKGQRIEIDNVIRLTGSVLEISNPTEGDWHIKLTSR